MSLYTDIIQQALSCTLSKAIKVEQAMRDRHGPLDGFTRVKLIKLAKAEKEK